ncbi:MAG: hypothetical protein AAFQ41_00750 [Cyanobacteria bacterium J06623_7]
MNKILSIAGGLLLPLLLSTPSLAFGCWAKPHEPLAVVVAKIIEIKPSRRLSDPVVYILEADVWLKGKPRETVILKVDHNLDRENLSGCDRPFVGEIGEVWAFQGFAFERDSYVFDRPRGIRLKDSEGNVVKQIPLPLIEFYNRQLQAKGDVYQSQFDYQLEQFWQGIKKVWRSYL